MSDRKRERPEKRARNSLEVRRRAGESQEAAFARLAINPAVRHAATAAKFAAPSFGGELQSSLEHDLAVIEEAMTQAGNGDKAFASRMLAAQAVSLDTIFTELARRSAVNAGNHLHATERYMRLALKAQSNCRATLEALSKLHQPREQTVKHVHVNEGGQAVVADQIHQHRGQNEKSDKQCRTTGAARECPAMLGENTEGNRVPVASGEGAEAVPNARRDKSRRA